MSGSKVAICHQTFLWGDAIGHDGVEMYYLLKSLGAEPIIACEGHRNLPADVEITSLDELERNPPALLIYHHSQYWAGGERLLAQMECPVLLRYHNITPAHFFAPYSSLYATVCEEGRHMTKRLLQRTNRHLWIADSAYNKEDLVEAGAPPESVRIVPPFNRLASLFRHPNRADYGSELIDFLFVGRLAPNKGHSHLLEVTRAFLNQGGRNVRLRIVGSIDPELGAYHVELARKIAALNLQGHVELIPHSTDDELLDLFRTAHIYLCFSEHEGFCVPVVEAQAVGLPVVGSGGSAVQETAGPDQFVNRPPRCPADYSCYAALVNRVICDGQLRSQLILEGERNVRGRFSAEAIENAFTGALDALLANP